MAYKKKEEDLEEKPATVKVRAHEIYKNGTIPSGAPQWKAGEVREIPYADFQKMKRDFPTNWEVMGV